VGANLTAMVWKDKLDMYILTNIHTPREATFVMYMGRLKHLSLLKANGTWDMLTEVTECLIEIQLVREQERGQNIFKPLGPN
jgi:hypothetical protein